MCWETEALDEPIRLFKENDKSEHFWRAQRKGMGWGGGVYLSTSNPEMLPFVSETVGHMKQRHTTGKKARYKAGWASYIVFLGTVRRVGG